MTNKKEFLKLWNAATCPKGYLGNVKLGFQFKSPLKKGKTIVSASRMQNTSSLRIQQYCFQMNRRN